MLQAPMSDARPFVAEWIALRPEAYALYDAASFRCGVEQPGSSSGS
jgi:hypothetical protein